MNTTSERAMRFLVRLSPELTTKARRTRRRFQRRLVANLRDALATLDGSSAIESRWSRLLVEADDPLAPACAAAVFGVSSVSVIDATVSAELDVIVRTGENLYAEDVERAGTYAVAARRTGRHSFSSQDIRVRLGAALNPHGVVNLDRPALTVSVEVRDGEAFFFKSILPGVGGLPLGVEGKAVCLLSGGFDSAAAAWLMLKRGVSLEYVFCNLAGGAYERSVASVAKVLADDWSFGDRPLMHVVPFADVVDDLRENVTPRYWQVLLKRLMYRAAERVAAEVRADGIVTGEAMGQVSSQTLGNLRAINDAASIPVFRPLLGYDKNEIIRLAERVGTSALSARVREYCAIVPDRPVTNAKPHAVRNEESTLDFAILEGAVSSRRVLELRGLSAADLVEPYVFIDDVPDGAVVLDCRPRHQYEAWHFPGARWMAPRGVTERLGELDKERTYLLYCELGVRTAPVAELMQRVGYEAYSFRGGSTGLRKWLSQQSGSRLPAPAPEAP